MQFRGDVQGVKRRKTQALPYMQNLPEYKAIEDDESRKAAFAKFVKRQKAGLNHLHVSLFAYSH